MLGRQDSKDCTLGRLYWEDNWKDNWEECTKDCTWKSVWGGLYIWKTLHLEDCTGKNVQGRLHLGDCTGETVYWEDCIGKDL